MPPDAVDALSESLREHAYLADRGLATVLHLSLVLEKPLLLEGEAGVGKTELAKVLADITGGRLIRLQCYEGIDVAHALYDWSYARQLLYIRTLEAAQAGGGKERLHELFGREFLERRPLLDAIENDDPQPPVLLIDEIDRADDEFEAFLLELLSDFQVTIPEIGTIRAARRPAVILTSNRTRELHDALKRRCLYHWIGHPSLEREIEIVRARVPGVPERLAAEAAAFVQELRRLDLAKSPGVAETIDWTQALLALGQQELDAGVVDATLGSVLKYHEDVERVRDAGLRELVGEARGTEMIDHLRIPATRSPASWSPSAGSCARPGSRSAPAGCRTPCAGWRWSTWPTASRCTTRFGAPWSRATTTWTSSTPPSPPTGSASRASPPTPPATCSARSARCCRLRPGPRRALSPVPTRRTTAGCTASPPHVTSCCATATSPTCPTTSCAACAG